MATHEQGPIVGGHRRNNKITMYDGRKYASVMEARYAERLDLEKRAGIVEWWEPQRRLALEIPAPPWIEGGTPTKVATYIVDFDIQYASGERHLVECKGFWTREALLKRRIFEATWLRAHPDVRYRVITKLGAFGSATEEEPKAAAAALRIPRQKAISAAEFKAMTRGK